MGERIFPDDWTGLIALAVCSQLIGQGLLVYALSHVPPLVVGIAMLTQPALSALLGRIYYGETLTCATGWSAAMIVAALILVKLKPRRTRLARTGCGAQLAAMPTPLESLRLKLALPVGENAAFDGWNGKAVDSAAAQTGIDPAQARLCPFPRNRRQWSTPISRGSMRRWKRISRPRRSRR